MNCPAMHDNKLKIKLNRILIIRRDNIGDLVCTTPLFGMLKEVYPNIEIGVLVNSYNVDVLLGNPDVNHVFVYQKLKHSCGFLKKIIAIVNRIGLVLRIRLWSPDATILAKSNYDFHGLKFARHIGAKNVIGFMPDKSNQLNQLPDICLKSPDPKSMHEVEALACLLNPLCVDKAIGPLRVFVDGSTAAEIKKRLPQAEFRVALHISAREPERRWGCEKFIALVDHLLKSAPNLQIVLFWSPGKADNPLHPGDDVAAERIIASAPNGRLVAMPTRNLTELISALSFCNIFIGADGGAMHLAVALNKMILALFENKPDKLCHWYPWQANSVVLHSNNKACSAVDQISLGQVLEGFDRLKRYAFTKNNLH